ncbi:GroES-like protein [Dichomitus squalens LYAD-421 SS1]|uniref:GroES-like protein n=1 Tax=Dichomitus squalens (strain LYAD-421) TaxID=732165 RepID=R7SRC5_DICSQ|nr:GroES-like protein [Dichomitus squalens LYAD-421 SS1]EJF58621.1 GroES-like protein [Dichomitus squalens LYAD-421 SS1]
MSTPTQQKALFLQSKQGEFTLGTREVPQPGAGDIVVKNEAIGLNPVDWKIQTYGLLVEKYPAILGLDATGTVEAVGQGVTAFKKGDRVIYQGVLDNDRANFQQYTLINESLAAELPGKFSFEAGATLPLAYSTAAVGLYHQAGGPQLVPPWAEGGKSKYAKTPIVVLGGASVVGSLAIQLAKLSGFSPIITTASPKNVELLTSYGATHVLDRSLPQNALISEVTKIAGGPVSLVYDAISLPETQAAGYALLAPNGKLLTVLPPTVTETTEGRSVVSVLGVIQRAPNVEFGKALLAQLPALLESGDIKPLRVEVIPGGLGGITAGLAKLKNNQVSGTKLVVRPPETA